jgi:hypothetical protein
MSEFDSDKQQSSLDALAKTGLSLESIQEVSEALKTTRKKDNRVCVCGHTMTAHNKAENGVIFCRPSALDCNCKRMHPVITTDNLRPFKRKTSGHKTEHALMLGVARCIEMGGSFEWIEDPLLCERCQEEKIVFPVCLTSQGHKTPLSMGHDYLLCDDCFGKV